MAKKTIKTFKTELFEKLDDRFISLSMMKHPEIQELVLALRIMGDYDWDLGHFNDDNFKISVIASNIDGMNFVTIILVNNIDFTVDDLIETAQMIVSYNNDLKVKKEKLDKLLQQKQLEFNKEIEDIKNEILGKPKKIVKKEKPLVSEEVKENTVDSDDDNNPV